MLHLPLAYLSLFLIPNSSFLILIHLTGIGRRGILKALEETCPIIQPQTRLGIVC